MNSKKIKTAQLIFPNQLFKNIDYLDKTMPVFLVEEYLFFKQYQFHKQKLAFHRASMKFYEFFLNSHKFQVEYINTNSSISDIRELIPFLEKENFESIRIIDVCDYWLEKRISKTKLNLEIVENQLFINTKEDLKDYFEAKKFYHQTDFYKQQRISRHILMDGKNPIGGKWTYDQENRKKYPQNKKAPAIHFPNKNNYYKEAREYVEDNFSSNYGNLTSYQIYPNTFEEAESWYIQFLENRFHEFGSYEDSIVEHECYLHHSILSPLMNVGLLNPKIVIDKAIQYATLHHIPINSLEGFIRQILGWREFVRGLYLYEGKNQRTKNYWNHKKPIPKSFYNATTHIKPLDSTLKKVFENAYSHHIERLMIIANFTTLLTIDPNEVYKWFMEMFIDAYDWVMVPNVYGMSSFSDGGKMSTKLYISGSNYIKKMSNYKHEEWCDKWDALYWNFINQHRNFFKGNPRLSIMVRTLDKMPDDKKKSFFELAHKIIDSKF